MKNVDEQTFYFQWHITDKCNLNCAHCYQNHPDRFRDIDVEQLESIADMLDQACKKWGLLCEIAITGGEPFSRKNDLIRLLRLLEEKDSVSRVDILSNGLLINDEIIQELNKLKKLNSIQISIEGHTKELHEGIRGEDTYERTLDVIKDLKKNNLNVSVMMTLSLVNYQYIEEVYNLLKKLDVDYFAVDRFIPEGIDSFGYNKNALSPDQLKFAYETVKKLFKDNKGANPKLLPYRPLFCLLNDEDDDDMGASCSIGVSSLTIMPDGTVFPCRRLPIPIGNIFTDGIYKIWYGSDLLWSIRKGLLTGKCGDCEHLFECKGCRATAYAMKNDFFAEDPLCWKK